MDYQAFLAQLPELYSQWGQETVTPKSEAFQSIINTLSAATSPNILQLLNCTVGCLDANEVYCEVGPVQAATLVGALLNHPDCVAWTIGDFGPEGDPEIAFEALVNQLEQFGLADQVLLHSQTVDSFFYELRSLDQPQKIGVYYYRGPSDYRSQLLGLALAKEFLADQALIIVDNSDYEAVEQAIVDFMLLNPVCRSLIQLKNCPNRHSKNFYHTVHILGWDKQNNELLEFTEIERRNQKYFLEYLQRSNEKFIEKNNQLKQLLKEAASLHYAGHWIEAIKKYLAYLEENEYDAEAWHDLGMTFFKLGNYSDALRAVSTALNLDDAVALRHYSLGMVLQHSGQVDAAIAAYYQALERDPNMIDAYNNIGTLLMQQDRLSEAEAIYRQATVIKPDHFGAYLNLGNIAFVLQNYDAAIAAYETALRCKPGYPDSLMNLAIALEKKGDIQQANLYFAQAYEALGDYGSVIKYYQQYLNLVEDKSTISPDIYLGLANAYQIQNHFSEAIATCQEGAAFYPNDPEFALRLVHILQQAGQTQAAIQVARDASVQFPDNLALKLAIGLTLPVIYESEAEIEIYREHFIESLTQLVNQTPLDTELNRRQALKSLNYRTTFLLQYQGKDDRDLQRMYGEFVHRVMVTNYPQWSQPLSLPALSPGGRLRVGYVSDCLRFHTVGQLFIGWLKHADQNKFETYCYHLNAIQDQNTQKYRLYSRAFHHIPNDLEAVCQQIINDRLHILVFLDLGMYPLATQIAALRLAPIQCLTWGHPITSGLPTIDYFLSSDLMEPENGDEHYTEQLVRLPNISIAYEKPIVPEVENPRAEFGFAENDIIYLSCQSLFKYLPRYDFIFPAIAQQVKRARFAFISHSSQYITDILRERLYRAFKEFNLDYEQFCIILPRLNHQPYLRLNLAADIFLDTLSWSGGNTTLEAIACGLPVVTCPGEFMRGRHAYGILRQMGVTATIAHNESEYIEIAVRLGRDVAWRAEICQQMQAGQAQLYEDVTCVRALEDFYRQVTGL
ncbi:tetratricopeptide repeat protein [Trichothermofontia sichuanensis B231]|uniref:tetratricopeptide repeat protein n=1 Tax=Trichothermofontia sichuanensis TaxID=3045816 RepID=UPI0022477DB7|nr:glycosyltransferase family 41 protein [Trichothermofontia sichuanensis]UZQ53645.1 tetratricopeptide repeat protein [Trichothermofontia sichuanensis B231]